MSIENNENKYLWGDYKKCSNWTGIPIGTLYPMVGNQQIPHHRYGLRLVRFNFNEILEWMNSKKVKTLNKNKEK